MKEIGKEEKELENAVKETDYYKKMRDKRRKKKTTMILEVGGRLKALQDTKYFKAGHKFEVVKIDDKNSGKMTELNKQFEALNKQYLAEAEKLRVLRAKVDEFEEKISDMRLNNLDLAVEIKRGNKTLKIKGKHLKLFKVRRAPKQRIEEEEKPSYTEVEEDL